MVGGGAPGNGSMGGPRQGLSVRDRRQRDAGPSVAQ
jgi:hypothetical protein